MTELYKEIIISNVINNDILKSVLLNSLKHIENLLEGEYIDFIYHKKINDDKQIIRLFLKKNDKKITKIIINLIDNFIFLVDTENYNESFIPKKGDGFKINTNNDNNKKQIEISNIINNLALKVILLNSLNDITYILGDEYKNYIDIINENNDKITINLFSEKNDKKRRELDNLIHYLIFLIDTENHTLFTHKKGDGLNIIINNIDYKDKLKIKLLSQQSLEIPEISLQNTTGICYANTIFYLIMYQYLYQFFFYLYIVVLLNHMYKYYYLNLTILYDH